MAMPKPNVGRSGAGRSSQLRKRTEFSASPKPAFSGLSLGGSVGRSAGALGGPEIQPPAFASPALLLCRFATFGKFKCRAVAKCGVVLPFGNGQAIDDSAIRDKQPVADALGAEKGRFNRRSHRLRGCAPVLMMRSSRPEAAIGITPASGTSCFEVFAKPPPIGSAAP